MSESPTETPWRRRSAERFLAKLHDRTGGAQRVSRNLLGFTQTRRGFTRQSKGRSGVAAARPTPRTGAGAPRPRRMPFSMRSRPDC